MQLMQVVPSCGQICNTCKWRHLVANFANYASGAIWWSNLLLMQVDSFLWQNLQHMQVAPSGGHICKLCKWRHLVVKFATNANGAIWWPNLQLVQVVPSGGQICNHCKWRHLVAIFATNASGAIWWPNLQLMQVVPCCCQVQSKLRSQFLGPLCLWQCFVLLPLLNIWPTMTVAFVF